MTVGNHPDAGELVLHTVGMNPVAIETSSLLMLAAESAAIRDVRIRALGE